jgi:hypothetical protein
MLAFIFLLCSQNNPAITISLPFIKADTVCTNKQNEQDKTQFTIKSLDYMVKNYKPVKVYYAMYSPDGKEEIIPLGTASCVYITKDQIFARCDLEVAPPKEIKNYVLNAKTYAGRGDFDFSDNCIYTIKKADIKYFILRPKEKAILFE